MSARLKSVLIAASAALVVVALAGCDPSPSATDPQPTRAAAAVVDAPTVESEPTATATPIVVAAAASPQPTATAAPTPRPRPAVTATPTVSAPTPTPAATPTAAPEAVTPTASPEPTATATATPVVTPTASPEATATPAPTPRPDAALAFDPLVTRGTLSNGMVYYIRHNEEPRERVQLWLIVKAGSILEEEEERGLAHFVEHMAFNGTERFAKQEIVEYLESIGSNFGPDVNASTGFDSTNYFLEIPTDDPEVLETAFQILSDWAYAIAFDPEEVELERGVVVEEWRLFRGFGARFQENWFPLIFGDSRYNERSPIGLLEVIETAPPERLRGFYERWYRPDLMAVIAVGDIDTKEIEAKIRQHFAPPPEGEAGQASAAAAEPTTRPRFDLPEHEAPRVNVFSDPEAPGTQLFLLRKLPPESGQDAAALRRIIVNRLAFMMLNARLFERGQVEDPPYLGAGGSRGRFVDPIDLVQFGAWVEQDSVQPGFAALLEETQRARQHGFTESELAREKANLLSAIERIYKEREQRESADFAQEYTDHFLSGIPAPGIEAEWELYQAMLPEISLTDVDDVAASWAEPGNTVLLVMRPEGGEELDDEELASVLQAQLAEADSLAVEAYADEFADVPLLAELPTPGAIFDEEQIESIDAVRWTLSNGITVIAKQTDFKNDEIVFGAFSPGGHSLVDDADHVSAVYAGQLVAGSGVGEHDNVALDKLLAGKRVSVSPYIGELYEGFRGQTSPEDIETLFQLITLYATAPRLDPVYFSTYETSLRTLAETRADQPDAVFSDTVNAVLSQNHFRRRPLTLELLDELSIERAEAVYADRFADLGDATFVFVGAFEWESLRSLIETYLASLPTTGRAEQWKDVGIDPPTGLEDHAVHIGIEPRSRTRVYFAGDLEWTRQEALTLTVMAEMLTTRLRERLREQLGGTYSVGASARASLVPDAEYRISIGFGSDPARADELLMEVFEELAWLRDGGEQDYLDTAKELLRNPREEQLRDNGFWLGQIQNTLQRGLDFGGVIDFDDRLDALTLDDVVAAAQRYLTEDRYVRVVLLPEEG
ncbi:MAG: insulinase family protein [Chloroflexota bacterium]|nr:insulinase family protein [Chloroflexota bacterium]